MSVKFWNDFTIFDHPVCSYPNRVGHQIYHFMKGHHYILQDQYLFLSVHLSQKISGYLIWWPKCTFLWCYTLYITFTHPVFLFLYYHIWHPLNISFPTMYNLMGVKCTHYKVCSVESKLVHFSQFWGMKHFLGPVCDIWPWAWRITYLLSHGCKQHGKSLRKTIFLILANWIGVFFAYPPLAHFPKGIRLKTFHHHHEIIDQDDVFAIEILYA